MLFMHPLSMSAALLLAVYVLSVARLVILTDPDYAQVYPCAVAVNLLFSHDDFLILGTTKLRVTACCGITSSC